MHRARIRKQKTLKILDFLICVEDYHKQTRTQFLIQSPLGNESDGRVDNVTEVMIFPKGLRTEGNIITEGNISPIPPSAGSINDILYRKLKYPIYMLRKNLLNT